MGAENSVVKTESTEETLIFDILNGMKWKENRLWKTFCFKFEYKVLSKEASKYIIDWKEFSEEFLFNTKPDIKNDYEGHLLYYVFKEYFKMHNKEVRMYRIYMLFFTLVLHEEGTHCLSFIDLLFEKIIYNLELEIHDDVIKKKEGAEIDVSQNSDESKSIEESLEKVDAKDEILDNQVSQWGKSSHLNLVSRRGMDANNLVNLNLENDRGPRINNRRGKGSSPFNRENLGVGNANTIDQNLLQNYNTYCTSMMKDFKSFVRVIPYGVFKEIMYVYFQNNIHLWLQAFKNVVTSFEPEKWASEKLVKNMKSLKPDKINLDNFNDTKIYTFIERTFTVFLKNRKTINKTVEKDQMLLSFDDIYVYMEMNSYFFEMNDCYIRFKEVSNYSGQM